MRPVELRPIELLLDALEGGVADRAVVAQRDQAPSLGLGRGAHDRRVAVLATGGRVVRWRLRRLVARGPVPVRAVARELLLDLTGERE